MFWTQECTLKPTWLPSVQGNPYILMSKESTLPMLRLWTLKQQCFNKNCCRSSILKQDKLTGECTFFKTEKKNAPLQWHKTWYSFSVGPWWMEKCVLQWEETFPVNVSKLVSTEQTTIKKRSVNSLYWNSAQNSFFVLFCFDLMCFCKSLEVLNWLTFYTCSVHIL